MKILVYIVVVVFVGLFSFSAGENVAETEKKESAQRMAITERYEKKEDSQIESFPDVVERVLPSVIGIEAVNRNSGSGSSVSLGSGVIVSEVGYAVTNQHVVGENPYRINITLYDGSIREGKLCWSDKSLDVAVVKFEGSIPAVAAMGEYTNLRVGEDVFAIGNPLSLQFERSVTKGIVSAVNRTITVSTEDSVMYMEDLIQTDASINPGNSGGPLLNSKGEVVGINTVRVQSAEGMGFAIPINICESVVENLEANGKYETPYLGLYAFTSQTAKYLKKDNSARDGLFVVSLDINGPAYKSGVKYGDVISEIDGIKVDSMLSLRRELFKKSIGSEVNLTVITGGIRREVGIKTGKMTENYEGTNQ